MSRQIVLLSVILSVALALQCYYDALEGKGKSHTDKNTKAICPDCSYCLKVSGKDGKEQGVYWGCGCSASNGIVDCKKKGKDSKKIKDDNGKDVKITYWCCEGDGCNSTTQASLTFAVVSTIFAFFFAK